MSNKCAAAGWPRPFFDREVSNDERDETSTVKTPALFVGGDNQAPPENDWLTFCTESSAQCRDERLCVACGLPLGKVIVLGHMATLCTDGPPCHPRCFALALKFCPRFQQQPYDRPHQTVAYVYAGDSPEGWRSRKQPADNRHEPDWSDIPLTRQCRALKRAAAIDLAKTNPLGA